MCRVNTSDPHMRSIHHTINYKGVCKPRLHYTCDVMRQIRREKEKGNYEGWWFFESGCVFTVQNCHYSRSGYEAR